MKLIIKREFPNNLFLMECLLFLSLYDSRWLFLGWPKYLKYFDIHQDIHTSNIFYAVAYMQTQMLTLALMYSSTEEKLEYIGINYIIDAFKAETKEENQNEL